jgi:hypothetical protein
LKHPQKVKRIDKMNVIIKMKHMPSALQYMWLANKKKHLCTLEQSNGQLPDPWHVQSQTRGQVACEIDNTAG